MFILYMFVLRLSFVERKNVDIRTESTEIVIMLRLSLFLTPLLIIDVCLSTGCIRKLLLYRATCKQKKKKRNGQEKSDYIGKRLMSRVNVCLNSHVVLLITKQCLFYSHFVQD